MTTAPARPDDERSAFMGDFETASVIMVFLLLAGNLWLAWRLWMM